ncbi:three-Cys-motif partner protein TcmP [Microbulbifer variabilis]|uniref:three-Cys-motif partner protein TcmP n=1 Tax=Microbulbifer variabilis TaxID=266805 RepID=UPI001CFE1A7C|nr:three-Cys-motif partner protein TcmP [Microbulbifer variabilis]
MSDNIVTADDGGLANEVGNWAEDKHQRLKHYVGIASGPRKKFLGPGKAGATYIDPYCAMGRAKIRNTNKFIDGSSILAWQESTNKKAKFSHVHIGDVEPRAVEQNSTRLHKLHAPVSTYNGTADKTIPEICKKLDPYGLHFAFLDPYNLGALPFTIIERLCSVKRMDLLIHVSSQDLQRNFDRYLAGETDALDRFAPGWRNSVTPNASAAQQRNDVFQYWLNLIERTGKTPSSNIEHVKGSRNQTLYWLVLVSGHELADKFWKKVSNVSGQFEFF